MTVWISERLVLALHDEQLREHGGATGLRERGLLESALARPVNRAGYAEPDVAKLGAMYALAIIRNHPFIDGNKRTAFVSMATFLALNGVGFDPPEADAVMSVLRMAASDMTDGAFMAWVREHCHAGPG